MLIEGAFLFLELSRNHNFSTFLFSFIAGTTICWQRGSSTVPVKLLEVGFGEYAGRRSFEATQEKLFDFMESLGLDKVNTSPAQVLVILLSRVMSIEEVSNAVNSSSEFLLPGSFPVLEAMRAILEEVG